ncbi:MAG: cyclic nucleotide-binding domain-containing protein [Actinomycetota bacterium]|nr:cyclic nucleotide-binding domain-containing protein [Actinomycetota bacterium]MDQ5819111.1 cyclic nucleotide-binding domain-containing protein [Actinomycetota bacterium]
MQEESPSLRGVPYFGHLDAEERAELEELLEPASFEQGEVIFEEGGPEGRLYVITSGTAEVYKSVLPGRREHLATLEAPTVVGEMGLLTEPRAAASVEARTPIEAYGIDRDSFLELLDADSPAACKVIYEIGRTLSERMAKTDRAVEKIIARLEEADQASDADVFRDHLIREWAF